MRELILPDGTVVRFRGVIVSVTPPHMGQPAPERSEEAEKLITLDQAAALVQRSKRTLERYKKKLPPPRVKGGGGRPTEWSYADIRLWLEKEFGRRLPAQFPAASYPPRSA